MPRWLSRMIGTAVVVGILAAPAAALDPFEQARWQIAANQARTTLLVPETPGFALQEIRARPLTCGGDTLGQAFATWSSPDGRTLQLGQGRPFACGDGPESTLISELVVSGNPASYLRYEGEPQTSWRLLFERDGASLDFEASFDDLAVLVAVAERAVPVAPSPGRALSVAQLTGQVIKTVGADVVVVNSDGRRLTVRLAGIRAPQAGRGDRPAGCRFKPAKTLLRRALPRGAAVLVETDPLLRDRDAKGRLLGYVRRRTEPAAGSRTANFDLITSGAVLVAPGRFRFRGSFVSAERLARRDDRGLFGDLCKGSLAAPKPPEARRPVTPPPTTEPPPRDTGPARSDAYNCDNFPLADGTTAQEYLNRYPDDPSGLDGDNDGVACE